MDAITLLRNDHKTVEQLFKRFEKAGDGALVEKRQIVDRIVEELSIHATIEEQLFYPVARATVPGTEDIALESLEEHHVVKWVLSELDGMDPAAERFDAKVTVLIENVRHHVEEEEGEFFPKVRNELGRKALGDLGDALEKAKSAAPTHPHPRSPDTPKRRGRHSRRARPGHGQRQRRRARQRVGGPGPDRHRVAQQEAGGLADRLDGGPQAGPCRAQDGRLGHRRGRQDGSLRRVGRRRDDAGGEVGCQGHDDLGQEVGGHDQDDRQARRDDDRSHGNQGDQGNCRHRQAQSIQDGSRARSGN